MNENKRKSIENRDAKGIVLELVMETSDEKKGRLIEKYHATNLNPTTDMNHKIIVGTWFNRAVKAVSNGATEKEIAVLVDIIVVAINLRKHDLDISKAIEDNKAEIDEIMEKYVRPGMIGERTEKARAEQLKQAAKKRGVLKLHKEGKTNAEIAKELDIPEQYVIFWLKNPNW